MRFTYLKAEGVVACVSTADLCPNRGCNSFASKFFCMVAQFHPETDAGCHLRLEDLVTSGSEGNYSVHAQILWKLPVVVCVMDHHIRGDARLGHSTGVCSNVAGVCRIQSK